MKRQLIRCALAMMSITAPALAHHNIGMIDIGNPVWVRGTVTRYEPRDPHVLIHLQTREQDGHVTSLIVEGPIMNRLNRMHLARDWLEAGDVIEVCGFPFKKAGVAALPALHVQLIVMPDGRRQPWGPYGKLDNCVRPGDSAQLWVDLVNADPMAHEYWCKGVAYATTPSVAPRTLVEDVGRRIATPCTS